MQGHSQDFTRFSLVVYAMCKGVVTLMNTVDRESFVIKKLMRDACTRFKHTKYFTIENASY